MINFIKDAVTAVSGIKSFLFNTDYRNNFDLQNVEFPCCVLTPIMNKKYDLNNIIRESAELQMSIVESAPYDYTGDDLYAINKRCSDLALQIIANLQVKSKLDKELSFEFILPSGDELVSGVMCNLQVTMKQGSCIGAPSYVEVVVQPIKRESITTNGKHVISPSSGFNAMREVEVDVNVQVPPPPLEEKQVTITKAKTTEIITPDAEYGLSRVEVSTDIPLESKQITITENGITTIEASEGFEGIESVEVDVNIPDYYSIVQDSIAQLGLTNEQTNYINSIINGYYSTKKDDAKTFAIYEKGLLGHFGILLLNENVDNYNKPLPSCDLLIVNSDYLHSANSGNQVAGFGCKIAIFLKETNFLNFNSYAFTGVDTFGTIFISDAYGGANFIYAFAFSKYIPKIKYAEGLNYFYLEKAFSYSCIEELTPQIIPHFLNSPNNTSQTASYAFFGSRIKKMTTPFRSGGINYLFAQCGYLEEVGDIYMDFKPSHSNAFLNCSSLRIIRILNWSTYDLFLNQSSLLYPESISCIIQNAVGLADGATARTLTLHATAKTNWQNSEYYEQDLAVLSTKGITIA